MQTVRHDDDDDWGLFCRNKASFILWVNRELFALVKTGPKVQGQSSFNRSLIPQEYHQTSDKTVQMEKSAGMTQTKPQTDPGLSANLNQVKQSV